MSVNGESVVYGFGSVGGGVGGCFGSRTIVVAMVVYDGSLRR